MWIKNSWNHCQLRNWCLHRNEHEWIMRGRARKAIGFQLLAGDIWEKGEIPNWSLVNSSNVSYVDSKVQSEYQAWHCQCRETRPHPSLATCALCGVGCSVLRGESVPSAPPSGANPTALFVLCSVTVVKHNVKFSVLSKGYSSVVLIHSHCCEQISRTFSSCNTKTLYSLHNSLLPFSRPLATTIPLCF